MPEEKKDIRQTNEKGESPGEGENLEELDLDVVQKALEAEQAAIAEFIEEARHDGEMGEEAVLEMTALAHRAENLSRTWTQRLKGILSDPLGEFRQYRQEKKSAAYAIKDNPRVWDELHKRKWSLLSEVTQLTERTKKKTEKVTEFNEDILQKGIVFLQDYHSFSKRRQFYRQTDSDIANQVVNKLIEYCLKYKDLDRAIEIYEYSGEKNSLGSRLLQRAIHEEYIAIRKTRNIDENYYSYNRVANNPELQADVIIQGNYSPESILEIIRSLLEKKDRHFFLDYYAISPLSSEVKTLMDPELKADLFSFAIKNNLQFIAQNIEFFKEELESITPEERTQVFDQIIERLEFLYSTNASPDFSGCVESTNTKKIYLHNGFVFRIIQLLKITPDEQKRIWDACIPNERQINKYYNKKERVQAAQDLQENAYHYFLSDALHFFPDVVLNNGPVLLQYNEPQDPSINLIDFFVDQVISKKEYLLAYELLSKAVGNADYGDPFKELSNDTSLRLFQLILDANEPREILELLSQFVATQFKFLSESKKSQFFQLVLKSKNKSAIEIFTPCVDILPVAEQKYFIDAILDSKKESSLQVLCNNLRALPRSAESPVVETRALYSYVCSVGIADLPTVKNYVKKYINEGEEVAQVYIEELKGKAKGLIGKEVPKSHRKVSEYKFLVKYVFPDGNYSTYDKNLGCGDRLEHLKRFDYNKDGYPVELTGLLGYRLRTVDGPESVPEQDNQALLQSYQSRFQKISEFVQSRGPDNKALQEAFDKKISGLFDQLATAEFRQIPNLSSKEKMLSLFIVEAIRREKVTPFVPNTQILDLVVEYKYAYHENLGAYVQRTADDIEGQRDEVSKRYVLWQELSTIYGENIKHVLRHNIFEDLSENSTNYKYLLDAFGASISLTSETFELNTREYQAVDNIFKKQLSKEEKYKAVIEKLADLFGPQLKLKGDDEKKALQQRVYDEERAAFIQELESSIPFSDSDELNADRISERMAERYSLNPRQIARFENTFSNDQIPPARKFSVLSKQVIDMFGSNIKFKDDEQATQFEESLKAILAPLSSNLNKTDFFAIIPKLVTLRNEYRFGINSKLEELFTLDLNAINREVAKFEEVVEVERKESAMGGPKVKEVVKSAKKRNIRSFITKTKETANARMGAYLCISGDTDMWSNKRYLEAVDVDEETGKCLGLTMYLEIPATDGKKYLFFGPNPFESTLTQVSAEKYLDHQYKTAIDFAQRNGFDGIVVPADEGQILGYCTNRGGNFPDLIKAKRLRDKKKNLRIVDFGKKHELGKFDNSSYGYDSGALIWEKAA